MSAIRNLHKPYPPRSLRGPESRLARWCNPPLSWLLRMAPVLALVALVAAAPEIRAQADPPELKLSTALAPAYPLGKAGLLWAEALNSNAQGAFEVRQYPAAVLAGRDPARELQALEEGAADLAVGSALAWSARLPALAAYVLPWQSPDARAQELLLADGALFDRIAAAADRAGVVLVAVAPLGERVLSTVRDAVTAPEQATGLRIRSSTNPLVIDTFGALGIRTEAMSLRDARAAFAGGALDGQEAMPSTLAATRIGSTRQKFVTRWGAFADVMVFAVRREIWDRWSGETRQRARAAAQDAAREAGALAREEQALGELNKQGITIALLAPVQRAAFRAAVQSVWDRWTPVIGADIVAAAVAAAVPK